MAVHRFFPLLSLLAACLLLQEAPPRCPDDCAPFSCDALGVCLTECRNYTDADCVAGLVCVDETCVTECLPEDCAHHLTCNRDNVCLSECSGDHECRDGFVCGDAGDCEPACVDSDCPGGFMCKSYSNECNDRCYSDSDCRDGWSCCDDGDEFCGYMDCYRD